MARFRRCLVGLEGSGSNVTIRSSVEEWRAGQCLKSSLDADQVERRKMNPRAGVRKKEIHTGDFVVDVWHLLTCQD